MLLRESQIAETAAHIVLSAAGIVSADGLLEQPAAVSCNYHSEQDFVITSEGGCRKYEICKAQVCGLQLLRACWLEASSTLRLPQRDVHASAVTAGAKPTGTGNRQAQRFHCSSFASRRMYHVHACVNIWVCANHAVAWLVAVYMHDLMLCATDFMLCLLQAWPASELLFSYSVGNRADTQASMQLLSADHSGPSCTYPGMDTFLLSIVPPGAPHQQKRNKNFTRHSSRFLCI